MNTELSLLIRAGNIWYVSDEVGKKGGWLAAKVVTDLDKLTPPLKGWQFAGGGTWQNDLTLECSREVIPACTKVSVVLQGKAKKKHPELAGSYLPVKGKINRGRWVSSYQQHSFAALQLSSIELLHICVFDKY